MKGTKYGKSPQKTIYIPPDSEDFKTWKDVVDYAEESRQGIGSLLMAAWQHFKISNKV